MLDFLYYQEWSLTLLGAFNIFIVCDLAVIIDNIVVICIFFVKYIWGVLASHDITFYKLAKMGDFDHLQFTLGLTNCHKK